MYVESFARKCRFAHKSKKGSPENWVTKLSQESSIVVMDKVPNCSNMIGEFFGKRQVFSN